MFKHGRRFADGTLWVMNQSGKWITLKEAAQIHKYK